MSRTKLSNRKRKNKHIPCIFLACASQLVKRWPLSTEWFIWFYEDISYTLVMAKLFQHWKIIKIILQILKIIVQQHNIFINYLPLLRISLNLISHEYLEKLIVVLQGMKTEASVLIPILDSCNTLPVQPILISYQNQSEISDILESCNIM